MNVVAPTEFFYRQIWELQSHSSDERLHDRLRVTIEEVNVEILRQSKVWKMGSIEGSSPDEDHVLDFLQDADEM